MGYLDDINVIVEGPSNNPTDYKNLKELNEEVEALKETAAFIDNEDLANTEEGVTKFANKQYDSSKYSGLGRVYLRKNIVDAYVDNQFVIHGVGNSYYLLYAWQNKLYAICNAADDGLVMDHNIIVRDSSYDRDAVRGITDGRELGFTESSNVYTITLPNGNTVTSTELNQTEIKYLSEISTEKKNVLNQDMVDDENTIYHLQYDYDLLGETITIRTGSCLQFDGGSITNGIVEGLTTATPIFWNGSKFVEYDGVIPGTKRSGTLSEVPTEVINNIYIGFMYIRTDGNNDTKYPIYYGGNNTWYDATGSEVTE